MKGHSACALTFFIALIFGTCFLGCGMHPAVLPPQSTNPPTAVTALKTQNNVRLKAGDKAPEFGLQDISDGTVSLSQLAGQKVVINMWWLSCHGCTEEMSYLQEFYENWQEPGLKLLAINVYDTVEMMREFARSKGLTFTLLGDAEKKLNAAYTNAGVPTTFFIDGDSIIRAIKDGAFESAAEIEKMYRSY